MNRNLVTCVKSLLVVLLSSGLAFFIQSCDEDDPGPKEVLLTVNVDPGYFSADLEPWIFISDKNGKTIDVRQATDSTHIKFLGTPRGTVTLTIFTHFEDTDTNGEVWHSFGFNSYQQILTGSTINLRTGTNDNTHIPEVIASVPFTLQDYDDSDKPADALMFTDGTSTPYSVLDYNSNVYTGTNFSSKLVLRENPARILAATYRNGVPVYRWLNDVEPGEAVEVSFDSFVPSKTIPINKKATIGSVKTMSGGNFATGYIFSDLYGWQLSKSSGLSELPRLGYLEGFEKYFVHVVLNPFHEKDNVYYTKAGTVPQAINLPDYTYSINNEDLYDLSVDFSNDYSYRHSFFTESNAETQAYWSLHTSDAEYFRAPSIPGPIKKAYPMLKVDGLKLEFVSYSHWLDGYSYAEYVGDHLANSRRDVFEELRYLFVP